MRRWPYTNKHDEMYYIMHDMYERMSKDSTCIHWRFVKISFTTSIFIMLVAMNRDVKGKVIHGYCEYLWSFYTNFIVLNRKKNNQGPSAFNKGDGLHNQQIINFTQ